MFSWIAPCSLSRADSLLFLPPYTHWLPLPTPVFAPETAGSVDMEAFVVLCACVASTQHVVSEATFADWVRGVEQQQEEQQQEEQQPCPSETLPTKRSKTRARDQDGEHNVADDEVGRGVVITRDVYLGGSCGTASWRADARRALR